MFSGPQTVSIVLSVAGIVFLFICLVLIAFNRVPTLKSPQVIKAFGIELDVSIVTVLVLVGFVLSLSSIYLTVKNYEGQIADNQARLKALETQLQHTGKVVFTPFVVLEGITNADGMPPIGEVECRYVLVDGGNTLKGTAAVSAGVADNSLQLVLQDIPQTADIRRIEIVEKRPVKPRTWVVENLSFPLAPTLKMTKVAP